MQKRQQLIKNHEGKSLSKLLSKSRSIKKETPMRKIASLWIYQLGGLMLTVVLLSWIYPITAKSVLIGGLIHWLPNAYFALYTFRFRGAHAVKMILQSMYRGEFGKILLTALGFALTFSFVKPIDLVGLFAAFIGMTIYQWFLVRNW